MTYNLNVKINEKKVPLNEFIRKLIFKILLAIIGSLKGMDENEIQKIEITALIDNENK